MIVFQGPPGLHSYSAQLEPLLQDISLDNENSLVDSDLHIKDPSAITPSLGDPSFCEELQELDSILQFTAALQRQRSQKQNLAASDTLSPSSHTRGTSKQGTRHEHNDTSLPSHDLFSKHRETKLFAATDNGTASVKQEAALGRAIPAVPSTDYQNIDDFLRWDKADDFKREYPSQWGDLEDAVVTPSFPGLSFFTYDDASQLSIVCRRHNLLIVQLQTDELQQQLDHVNDFTQYLDDDS